MAAFSGQAVFFNFSHRFRLLFWFYVCFCVSCDVPSCEFLFILLKIYLTSICGLMFPIGSEERSVNFLQIVSLLHPILFLEFYSNVYEIPCSLFLFSLSYFFCIFVSLYVSFSKTSGLSIQKEFDIDFMFFLLCQNCI